MRNLIEKLKIRRWIYKSKEEERPFLYLSLYPPDLYEKEEKNEEQGSKVIIIDLVGDECQTEQQK